MGRCGAQCSGLRDGNEYADVIEIGRFAHAQHCSAALIIALRSSIWNKGEFDTACLVWASREEESR
jgi:hypothetical protein